MQIEFSVWSQQVQYSPMHTFNSRNALSCRPFCYTNELLPLTSKHPSQLHLAPGLCTNRRAHKSSVFMKNTEKKICSYGFYVKNVIGQMCNLASDWHTFGCFVMLNYYRCFKWVLYLFTYNKSRFNIFNLGIVLKQWRKQTDASVTSHCWRFFPSSTSIH